MHQIIAPTLFQNKKCRLPGIGTLMMVGHSAKTNFADSVIVPPGETIEFVPADNDENGFNEFSAISELLQKKLEDNGSFFLNGIGTFIRNTTGVIRFDAVPVHPVFISSVEAKRAVRKEH